MNMSISKPDYVRKKTGKIFATYSEKATCPSNCPLLDKGCYGSNLFYLDMHWNKVSSGERGSSLTEAVKELKALPPGTRVRHNILGDLPKSDIPGSLQTSQASQIDDLIDGQALKALVDAFRGKQAFTFTHYSLSWANLTMIAYAVKSGFIVNISSELNNVDKKAEQAEKFGIPVAVVLPSSYEGQKTAKTPAGRPITICPEQTGKVSNCADCMLCYRKDRKAIVGFIVHAPKNMKALKAKIDENVGLQAKQAKK